jgi:hypothetical protein
MMSPAGEPSALQAQVEEIVRAAEAEAAAVRRDLAIQRRLSGRLQRLNELTDDLAECAEVIGDRLDDLAATLRTTAAGLAPTAAPALRDDGAAGTPAAEAPPTAARLLAIELAAAGRSRGDVDRQLRDAFDLIDTGPLLDDVFGDGRGPR